MAGTQFVVNPIWARYDEVVDIHWRLRDRSVYVERRTCPPVATTAARQPDTDTQPGGIPPPTKE